MNNMENNKTNANRTGKISLVLKKGLIVVVIPIITAIVGAVAGAAVQNRMTEEAIVKKMAEELTMIDDNRGLAQAIDDVKKELEVKDGTIAEYSSEITELNERLSGNGDKVAQLEADLETERNKNKEAENKLAEYHFYIPSFCERHQCGYETGCFR